MPRHATPTSFKAGHIPWCKGKKGSRPDVTLKNKSEKQRMATSNALKGRNILWTTGHTHNEETKLKISNIVRAKYKDPKYRAKCLAGGFRGRHHSQQSKMKTSKALKALWQDDEFFREKMSRVFERRPTKPELELSGILTRYFYGEWIYSGNRQIWIGKMNPDFWNVNGRKNVIELYGDYWHKDDNPDDRIKATPNMASSA